MSQVSYLMPISLHCITTETWFIILIIITGFYRELHETRRSLFPRTIHNFLLKKSLIIPSSCTLFHSSIQFSLAHTFAHTYTHTYTHTHTARVAAVHTHSPPTRVCVRSRRLAIGDSQMVGIRKGARVGAATILAHGVSCVVSEWKPVSHSVKRQVEHAAVAISASSSFVYSRNKEKKRGHLEWVQIFLAIL